MGLIVAPQNLWNITSFPQLKPLNSSYNLRFFHGIYLSITNLIRLLYYNDKQGAVHLSTGTSIKKQKWIYTYKRWYKITLYAYDNVEYGTLFYTGTVGYVPYRIFLSEHLKDFIILSVLYIILRQGYKQKQYYISQSTKR